MGTVLLFKYIYWLCSLSSLCCSRISPDLSIIKRLKNWNLYFPTSFFFFPRFISVMLSFSNKHKSFYSMHKHSSCTKWKTDGHKPHVYTHTRTHTKPPSGQGLTLTLKGLCLAPVISTPQAGYVVSISTSLPVCVYERVCRSTIYGVNSCRHPRHLVLIVTWVRVCVRWDLFLWEQLRSSSSSTDNARRIGTIEPLTAGLFVVVHRQEMRSCWGLGVCVRGAYGRAGPGQEENTNLLLGGLAGLMEMKGSVGNVSKQGGICGYTRHGSLSLCFPSLPVFSLLFSLAHSLHVTLSCEIAQSNVMANYLWQQSSLFLIPRMPLSISS